MIKTEINSIQIPEEFIDLCNPWHSGQDSMMYAIASTGNLTTGEVRPYDAFDDRHYTDEEWYVNLFVSLEIEIYQLLKLNSSTVDEQRADLEEFQKWVENIVEKLTHEYNLD